MDFYGPAQPNYTPPNGLNTLSDLMSLKKQKQDIEQQQLTMQGQVSRNQSLAATAQGDTQDMQERQAYSRMIKSGKDDQGNSIYGTDPATGQSSPDPAKVLAAIGRIAPKNGQAMAQSLLKTQTDRAGLEAASQSLDAQGRAMLMAPVQAAANDPNATAASINEGIDNLVQAHPEMGNAAKYLKGLAANWDHIPPEYRAKAAQAVAAHMQGGQAVPTQATPGQIDTGGEIQPGTIAPAIGGGGFTPNGAPVKKTLAPQVLRMPNETLRAAGGAYGPPPATAGQSRLPGSPRTAVDDMPPANASKTIQDAFAQSVSQAKQDIQTARESDRDYGTNTHVANVIRKLSKSTDTGPGTETWHTMLAGIPQAVSGKANDAGADYQTINSMLERQASMARSTMGLPNTNAGQGAAEALSGTTKFAPAALQTKNNLTQALVEGAHQFRQGLEKVGGFTTNPSPNAVAAFQREWTANFDPNVYRAIRAHDEHDVDEQKALQRELGPAGFKALSVKARNLQSLAETGTLPEKP